MTEVVAMNGSTLIQSPPAVWATKVPPPHLVERLQHHFGPRRARYIAHTLSVEELDIVEDFKDAYILARIKRMDDRRLQFFDRFVPVDAVQQRAFATAQMEWIRREQYLLSCRLGRSPNHSELSADFNLNRNGQRFRAYYVMKFKERMKRDAIRVVGT
jgi:hypothetical protein